MRTTIRICEFDVDKNNLKSPTTGDRLKATDESFYRDALSVITIPIIIIIDGLDKVNKFELIETVIMEFSFQGDIRHDRKYHLEFPFYSLGELSTDRLFVILSAEINSPLHKTIATYPHYVLELKSFSTEQRRLYIDMFFQRFNKVSMRIQVKRRKRFTCEDDYIRHQIIPLPK